MTGINNGIDRIIEITPPFLKPTVIAESITFKVDISSALIDVHKTKLANSSGSKLKKITAIGENRAIGNPKRRKLEIIFPVISCVEEVLLK